MEAVRPEPYVTHRQDAGWPAPQSVPMLILTPAMLYVKVRKSQLPAFEQLIKTLQEVATRVKEL